MITLSINAAMLGPVVLVLVISMVLGVALFLLGKLASGFGSLLFGFAEAIAGGGRSSYHSAPKRSKAGIACRTLLYFAVCVTAIVLCFTGGSMTLALLCAAFGGVTFPIGVSRLLS